MVVFIITVFLLLLVFTKLLVPLETIHSFVFSKPCILL